MSRRLLVSAFYRTVAAPFPFLRAFSEKWIELTSLKRFLTDWRINVVIDVGANEGQFAYKLRRLGYSGRIVSFEPDPRVYAGLQRRHGSDAAWRGYQMALGDAASELTMNLASNPLLNSFLVSRSPVAIGHEIRVPVRRLDDLWSELVDGTKEPRVLLKTDTQGYDLRVLRGATGCIEHIDGIFAELSVIPIYHASPSLEQALTTYREAGFDLLDVTVENRTLDGRILELNGLFVRHTPVP